MRFEVGFSLFVLLVMSIPGLAIYGIYFEELPPLTTFNVNCRNGSAVLRATSLFRASGGVVYFSNVDGVRHAKQSFPPDCFVTVQP